MAELEGGQNTLAFRSQWSYRRKTQGENSLFKTIRTVNFVRGWEPSSAAGQTQIQCEIWPPGAFEANCII